MTEKEIICVICPSSCHVKVKGEDGKIVSMEGYTCKRGKEYAEKEFTAPVRILTSTVKAVGYTCPVIAVRSREPIPKGMMMEAMEEIRKVEVKAPFTIGRVVIENILGTGTDIVLSNR